MALTRVNPTRMELTKLKKRLQIARRGHKLLKDKRDELMKQFMAVVKENMELRLKVEEKLQGLHSGFYLAAASTSPKILEESLIYPKMKSRLEVGTKNMMSVNVPTFSFDSKSIENGDIYSYGFTFTDSRLDEALGNLGDILPDLLKLAEVEKTAQMLAAEIERTRRRVNALEYIMIPDYQENIKYITMKLDENERGNITRLMKVKDMMIAQQFQTKQ
ncbi:MAG TPA: V-type ATP synthase subunit D [Clostridiales bacterium]|jgi:V/A-type H+-transporting ATPase subunit D|nr:V-type ATP synthase subunit D [Clostridiales bacterium]HBE12850.1 V-type ATP synthase subunit D [Clostridiales bacterium]HBK30498.1 V-type ATP synthase subunit D [Porphyromonadaceae bacterium]